MGEGAAVNESGVDPAETLPAGGDALPGAYLIALHPALNRPEFAIKGGGPVRIGRERGLCGIVVSGRTISREHCEIAQKNRAYCIRDLQSTNGLYVNRQRIHGEAALNEGDLIGLGSDTVDHFRFQRQSGNRPWVAVLPAKARWNIGRDPRTDITLAYDSRVSALHASVRAAAGGLELLDEGSLNGVWVNGRRVRRHALSPTDTVMIGATVLRMNIEADGALRVIRRDAGEGIALESVGLTRTVGKEKRILDRVSLAIRPGEFVGVLGPSGAGKSTLLTALNGYSPPDYGAVLVNETPLYPCLDLFRHTIGYVPQDDIVHAELTVEDCLHYVAKLRLPPDVRADERRDLVDTTIESLGLGHVRGSRVHQLSGGQRKRVSIGCELITRPGILFLDEPTSGMDPSTEERLMRLFQEMSRQGATILITTHILYNLDMLDRVVIMARGRLVFFGAPGEAMTFFGAEGKPLERPTQIFEVLEGELPGECSPGPGDPKEAIAAHYQKKYAESPLFARNVRQEFSPYANDLLEVSDKPGELTATDPGTRTTEDPEARRRFAALLKKPAAKSGPAFSAKPFSPRIFATLTRRNLAIKLVSPTRALFYLMAPVVLALVTLTLRTEAFPSDETAADTRAEISGQVAQGGPLMAPVLKELLAPEGAADPRDAAEIVYALKHEGLANLPTPISVLLMFVMTAAFMGTLMSCLDVSSERPIYRRERMANQKIPDYLASKLPFLLSLTAVQCAVFLGICLLKPGLREMDPISAYAALVAMCWAAVALGLFLSALDPTPGQFSVLLAIVAVLPQLVLSGGLAPDFYAGMPAAMQAIAAMLPARWGLEMLATAFYSHPDREALAWLASFVPETIGFDFGSGVYWRNAAALLAQALFWLILCAAVLRRQDRVR